MRGSPSWLVVAALALGGCDGVGSRAGGPYGGRPQPAAVGEPSGPPVTAGIGGEGGALVSPDGALRVEVPPGALAASVGVSIQSIGNTAPGRAGAAYRLGPDGTAFASPVALTFVADAAGRAVESLAVATQRPSGYWVFAPDVVRDAAAGTLTVSTTHFSDWALVVPPVPSAHDLRGPFSLDQTYGVPFSAGGTATLFYQGEDQRFVYYLLAGTIAVPAAIPHGADTCTPDAAELLLPDGVVDADRATGDLRWGLNAHWTLRCSGPGGDSAAAIYSVFDTLGIDLAGCARSYDGAPVAGPDGLSGTYRIDCGVEGTVGATWSFAAPACGQACTPAAPCSAGATSCASGTAVCAAVGPAPDGTPCGTGQSCVGGLCQ